MTTRLKLFNGALGEIGHRRLADTGEGVEAGRELVAAYDDVVAECLDAGFWNFAMETIKVDADTGVTPEFGFPKVFAKPTDWVNTAGVSMDENFVAPLTQYYDDDNYWSADSTPIYIRYVSNDTGLGMDLQRWPARFTRFVTLSLADRVCLRINNNQSLKDRISKDAKEARKAALNRDAMNDAQPKFAPASSWTLARSGGWGSRDRGSRGSLIG